MRKRKPYTEEEKVARKKLINNNGSKKYYRKNSEKIKAEKLAAYIESRLNSDKPYKAKGPNGLIMVDTESGDEFEYNSVRECHEDMNISEYAIRKGLSSGTLYNGYQFQRRV